MTNDITSDALELALQEALNHLYDPDYVPTPLLCKVLSCDPHDSVPTTRGAILRAIQGLRPPEGTPATAYTRRIYDLLHHRFTLKLTQEETAERLNVSRRTINRMQHRAVHVLAGLLWEHHEPETNRAATGQPEAPTEDGPGDTQEPENWQQQMEQELASLHRQSPNTISSIHEIIEDALGFLEKLDTDLGMPIDVVSVQPGLVTTAHPVAFHQVLICLIRRLAGVVQGHLSIYARLEDGDAKITLTGHVTAGYETTKAALVESLPLPSTMSISSDVAQGQAFIWIQAPSTGKVSVLVVDDNEDMARLYHDATIGTRYQITSLTKGLELLKTVELDPPDIIVLDVMLPDIDGWRVLMRLHENIQTRPIPVIVCSVVREEDLALSLGAAQVLTKPFRPQAFIQALDQAYPRV